MNDDVFVVIDKDAHSRNLIYRMLSNFRYTFPVEMPSEVEPYWPSNSWIIVRDQDDSLEQVTSYLRSLEMYHPVIAYGQTSVGNLNLLFNQGLTGYICWPDSDGSFLDQLRNCMTEAGQRVKQARASANALHRLKALSARESQVIKWMSEGKSNKEIAKILNISPRTIEIHRANALVKLEVDNSITAAVQFQIAQLGNQMNWFGGANRSAQATQAERPIAAIA